MLSSLFSSRSNGRELGSAFRAGVCMATAAAVLVGSVGVAWAGQPLAKRAGSAVVASAELKEPASWTPMRFAGKRVVLELGSIRTVTATLDGSLEVGPDGVPVGVVFISFDDGASPAMMSCTSDGITIDAYAGGGGAGGMLDFLAYEGMELEQFLGYEGRYVPVEGVLARFVDDVRSGASTAEFHGEARAMLAGLAVMSTDEYRANLEYSRLHGPEGSKAWCKGAAATAASILSVITGTGCSGLEGMCRFASQIKIGSFQISCSKILQACWSGQLNGYNRVYNWLLKLC